MKQDRINKLYEGLTNKELATLAFRVMADDGEADHAELELRRVASAVGRKSYECTDMEYQDWVTKFRDMAAFWSVLYWQEMAATYQATALLHAARADDDEPKVLKLALKVIELRHSRLVALDEVLGEVCSAHGIQPDSIRQICGAVPSKKAAEEEPHATYLGTLRRNFSKILNGDRA